MFLLSYEFVWNNLLVKNKFTKNSPEIHQEIFSSTQYNIRQSNRLVLTKPTDVLLRNKHRKLL